VLHDAAEHGAMPPLCCSLRRRAPRCMSKHSRPFGAFAVVLTAMRIVSVQMKTARLPPRLTGPKVPEARLLWRALVPTGRDDARSAGPRGQRSAWVGSTSAGAHRRGRRHPSADRANHFRATLAQLHEIGRASGRPHRRVEPRTLGARTRRRRIDSRAADAGRRVGRP
jgi:hypothetical protein